MNAIEQTPGVALLCDPYGKIIEVLRDEIAGGAGVRPGRDFTEYVDGASREKARAFLAALRVQQAVFAWEMNVLLDGQPTPLHFAGAALENHLLIVGTRSLSDAAQFYEEMIRINNEQTNSLRQAFKDLALQARTLGERDSNPYDEFTRLNNELVTAQRELAKKNVELGRLNDQKNFFLGMAAHDLRNPLSVILSYSEFLREDLGVVVSAEQLRFIEAIKRSSEFMLNLVNNLLDLSKIEAGRLELERARADLGQVVEANVALNRALAEKQQVKLALVADRQIPALRLDVAKIEQVLNNLIGNAIKFSPAHGSVEVRLDQTEAEAVICVKDQGPGIPPGEIERLFRPFERMGAQSAAREKSAGLGLAIAKRIVEGHRGRIWVESTPGHGSTFYFSLPLRAD